MATSMEMNELETPSKIGTTNMGGTHENLDSASKRDPTEERLNRILSDIESSDSPLGPTLRAVYSEKHYARFMEKLGARIKQHDRDIERMCNYHYQGFIDSIQELLRVRSEADIIKESVKITNNAMQQSGLILVKSTKGLVKQRQILQNISKSMEQIQSILPVLDVYSRLQEQMNSKRYYSALKTLEQLEHTYLPRLASYRFIQMMTATIPTLREDIKKAATSDLKDFLESIRKHSQKIGKAAMVHATEQQKLMSTDPMVAQQQIQKHSNKASKLDSTNPFDEDAYDDDDEEELSAQDIVDFSPVYRCLHIHTVLGAREEFDTYYRKQRKKQARLVLSPSGPTTQLAETLDGYKQYFYDVVGFFVVENHIANTTSGLVTPSYLNELWEQTALQKITGVVTTRTAYCTDSDVLLQIKVVIVLFSHTVQGYGYSVSRLYEMLQDIRDTYSEILMKQWVQVFETILEEDNYTPVTVDTQAEYRLILDKFPCEKPPRGDFPRRFPFSSSVPDMFTEIKRYICECRKFCEDMLVSHSEMESMVRKSTNLLLTRTLSGCLSGLVRKAHIGLKELIQLTINTQQLEDACLHLENFISDCAITSTAGEVGVVARLQGTSVFKDIRRESEDQIYQQLNLKIDEFLEIANYNWLLEESRGHASGYLMDLIAFLQSTFLSFTNLPAKVAQASCMSACRHLAHRMMDLLMDDSVRQLSPGALQQFNLDVIQCEQFANSEPVPGNTGGALQMSFVELRQLLDLFLEWDWSAYLADYGQPNSKYLRVNPLQAIALLEKMKDADKKKSSLFTAMKKTERDKKKLLDTVLRQLKGLTTSPPAVQ